MRDALGEHGLTLKDEQIFEGDYESQSGYDAMQRILALTPRPTAVFAFDDPMAIGAICAAWEAGVKVPDDISMIGYDDVEMARFSSPPLTTIRHPKAELGLLAVQQLVSRIRNKELEVESMTVQPELIVRRSVKSLR
ncbi:HTH-type transcriptional repressor PurR [compost metagenome]